MKRFIHISLVLFVLVCISHAGFSQGKKQFFEAYKALGDSCIANKNFYGAHQAFAKALTYQDDTEVSFKCAEACRSYQIILMQKNIIKKLLLKVQLHFV